MIWKIVVVLSTALYVQSEEDAISEQRVTLHHHKFDRYGDHLDIKQEKTRSQEEYVSAYPSYEFSYKVYDPETHDIKGQHETKEGDEVTGNYWLIEPNGRKRTVNYQANDDIGFNAQIAFTPPIKDKITIDDGGAKRFKIIEQQDFKNNNGKYEMEYHEDESMEDLGDISNEFNNKERTGNNDILKKFTNEKTDLNEQNNKKIGQNENVNNTDENDNSIANENVAESSQKATSLITPHKEECCDENKPRRKNRPNNVPNKGRRGKLHRNINQAQRPQLRNLKKNSKSELKNENNVKQSNVESNKNDNINANEQKKYNHDRHISTSGKSNSAESDNIESNRRVKSRSQEQNDKLHNGVRKESDDKEQNHVDNNNNFAVIKLIPNKTEIYEHKIFIYHPKMTSPKPKEELHKK